MRRVVRIVRFAVVFIGVVFVAPALASLAWWKLGDHPASWNTADWSSAGVLPKPKDNRAAAVYVFVARTGGLKGALSVHSWIVTKKADASAYDRYDVVGWGAPVRRNAYPADARWYSNPPELIRKVSGAEAEKLIPKIEAAVAAYPHARRGDYVIWPGPNSNTFIAYVLAAVPEIGAQLPANATGRDYAPGLASLTWSGRDLHATLGGYAGFALGADRGAELHFMGLTAGFDVKHPGLKIPGFGDVPFVSNAQAGE